MKLAIFDIDGTLVRSVKLGKQTFSRVMKTLFDFDDVSTDWHDYRHATDSGIIRQLFEERRGRLPNQGEIEGFRETFYLALKSETSKVEGAYYPIDGAPEIFPELMKRGWSIGVATGNWRKTGEFKLMKAGIPIAGIYGGYADDAEDRVEIIRASWNRASQETGFADFERVVYVGDAIWDIEASRRLGIGFVGVSGNGYDEKLKSEGTSHLVSDFLNVDLVEEALMEGLIST